MPPCCWATDSRGHGRPGGSSGLLTSKCGGEGAPDQAKHQVSGGRYSENSHGGVAQLVERYVRNVEVGGSSPLTSTSIFW